MTIKGGEIAPHHNSIASEGARGMKLIRVAALAAIGAALAAGPATAETKDLNFGIISTESQQNLKSNWVPFLADMEKKTGLKVKAFFAPDYAGVIEAMRFKKVDVAWFGNKSAMEAVDRAEGQIFVQTVASDGSPGYWSHLIVNKDSSYKTLDDVLKNAKNMTLGNGDPNSTSGFLVPSYYVFALNKIDAKTAFKRMVTANHETNALSVANKQVDVATNNNENLDQLKKKFPDKAEQIRVVWTSPLIPADPIVWRASLPAETKTTVKAFFLDYGVKGGTVAAEKKVLAGLGWAPFKASDNNQLLPIRQLELFKVRSKIAADDKFDAAEKKAKLADLDAKLAELQKQMAALKDPKTN
jgi:phosphonate transport system substrate-binding protein